MSYTLNAHWHTVVFLQAQLVSEGWQLHAAIGLKHPDHHIKHKPHLAVSRDGTSLLAAITLTAVRPPCSLE